MSHRICSYCNKPIVLVPSAQARAGKFGNTPSYYLNLFTLHGQCQVDKREAETSQLIRR